MSCAKALAAVSGKGLTATAKMVFITLASWAKEDGITSASTQAVADFIEASKPTTIAGVASLIAAGLLTIETKGKGPTPNVYRLANLTEAVKKVDHKCAGSGQESLPVSGQESLPVKKSYRSKKLTSDSQKSDTLTHARVDSDSLKEEERESPASKPESAATVAAAAARAREVEILPKPIQSGPPRFDDDPRIEIEQDDGQHLGEPVVNGWYLKTVFRKCLEAANIDPVRTPVTWTPVVSWLHDGVDPDDMYETISRIASRGTVRPKSLAYFDRAIRERQTAREMV